jgi:pyruvate/2-oxoglutarate dehydrogenase complex dihydrolipoamide dehydrogenase (E3) component
MGVIGLGAIGVEIALARLGVEVHAFDASERVAGVTDPVVKGGRVLITRQVGRSKSRIGSRS